MTNTPTLPATPLLVDARAAARMLAIGSRKLWSITNCGELPCVRIGRAVRYDVADIHAYIESRKGVTK